MRSRAERILLAIAIVAALVALAGIGAAMADFGAAEWVALVAVYLTGVSYGFAEMVRLFRAHRRRCRECFEGAGPHLRWWAIRVAIILVVSLLPVVLLLPLVSRSP